MLFPNLNVMVPPSASQEGLTHYPHGWTHVCRGFILGDDGEAPLGWISVCTLTPSEMRAREDAGEFSDDLLEEHTTNLWFADRASYLWAHWVARRICRSRTTVSGIPAEHIVRDVTLEGVPCPGLIMQLSPHHVEEAA